MEQNIWGGGRCVRMGVHECAYEQQRSSLLNNLPFAPPPPPILPQALLPHASGFAELRHWLVSSHHRDSTRSGGSWPAQPAQQYAAPQDKQQHKQEQTTRAVQCWGGGEQSGLGCDVTLARDALFCRLVVAKCLLCPATRHGRWVVCACVE